MGVGWNLLTSSGSSSAMVVVPLTWTSSVRTSGPAGRVIVGQHYIPGFRFWAQFIRKSAVSCNTTLTLYGQHWSEPRVPRLPRVITKVKMKKCLSLSRSKKKSYAAALGPASSGRKPGEVYNGDILYPTGITNVANNCYINAVVQYLFKHPKMPSVFYQATSSDPNHCSKHCTTGKFNVLMLRKFLIHACALLK